MPHAVEMPSFMTDDSGPGLGPMLSPNRPPYDLPSHVRHSHEKLNGFNHTPSHTSIKGGLAEPDGYFEDGITNTYQMNGDTLHDGSVSLLPIGRTSASSWDYKSSTPRSGSALSLNGAMNGNTNGGGNGNGNGNGMIENGRKSPALQNGNGRTSYGDRSSTTSTNGYIQPSIIENKPTANGNFETPKKASIPSPIATNPQSTGPLTYSSSLLPATPLLNESPTRAPSSPHRFSSPPAYHTPLTPSPANQHPGSTQLKHRHTLQVPKPGTGRSSRDGDDAVFASGRFSPTSLPTGSARRGSLSLNRRNTQSIHSNMPHEEIPLDEDAMRWAEAVRQKRASKRKRRDEEDDDRVLVGTKVDQNHQNYVTAYNMLTGIRFTVSRTNAKLDRPLTDADFDARHKFSFDVTGNELTPSAKYDFKFKDYAPWVFRHLRAKFKLDPADYLMSLTSKYILSELGSPGKSGSFFYFSRDYKYIIKTIHHSEHKFLRKILKDYYLHVEENPNTLLSQFYGLHRVKIGGYGKKVHFVVMNNLFPPHRDIHQTFDLKGSTIGRDFKEEDLEKNPRATLKDLNWLRRGLHLEFGAEKKRIFIEQMAKDVRFLQRLHIMDYSMLVGIHDLRKGNQENLRDKTLQVFQPGGDTPLDEPERGPDGRVILMRTPSKLENARKARELRQIIKQEKPIPIGQSSSRMPDQLEENTAKKDFVFYSDDGGFRATHEDNSPGEEIFFLSIIDCLTHYGFLKKAEHFFKGLNYDKKLISPIRPEAYGERFIEFIEGITKSAEEAAREAENAPQPSIPHTNSNPISNRNTSSLDSGRKRSDSQHIHRGSTSNSVIQRNENDALRSEKGREGDRPEPRTLSAARSPSAERSGGMQGQILPIVEEMGEASSTGGRSGRSGRSALSVDDNGDGERRPRTPAKDRLIDGERYNERPMTPPKDYNPNNPPTTIRMLDRSSLDKELPPIPTVASPADMSEKRP